MEAGQECPTSICLTQTSNVPPTGLSLPLLLEDVDDHILDRTLMTLCSTQFLVTHVCGGVLAYQRGVALGFLEALDTERNTIESVYISRLSLYHGPESTYVTGSGKTGHLAQ